MFIGIGVVSLILVVVAICKVVLQLLGVIYGGIVSGRECRLDNGEEVTLVDAGSRPIGDVYLPFGQDDGSIQDGSISGGPLE